LILLLGLISFLFSENVFKVDFVCEMEEADDDADGTLDTTIGFLEAIVAVEVVEVDDDLIEDGGFVMVRVDDDAF